VRNQIWLSTLPPSHLAKLFGKDLTIEFIEELYEESILSWNATNGSNDVDRTIQYYIENYLQNNILAKIDRAGMLNSLEVRTPFLDISLIDLVRTIPPQLKFDGRNTKAILKKAFSPTLPPYIVRRGKKGFGVPAAKWFANKTLTINTKTFDGLMDVNFLEALYNQHLNRKGNWHAFLWAYLALERWSARPMFSQKT
jgi:asparagine synthase (glutamine-hydrolysing)